jgi:large subunit ribosomal protein L29
VKTEEMRSLSVEELKKRVEDSHQELFNLRFRLSTRQLVNHRELPKVKKEIARLETIIREKELGSVTNK